MSIVKLHRYVLPRTNNQGGAIVVIGSDGFFSAVSNYGNYAYLWSSHGREDFREFLVDSHCDLNYFAGKLDPEKEFDALATRKAVQEKILYLRRIGSLSKWQARDEWYFSKSICYDDDNSQEWYNLSKLPDVSELIKYTFNSNVKDFCLKILPRLSEVLKYELEKERLES